MTRCLPTQVAQALKSRIGCKNSENLVDDEIPIHGDSHASSSHEVSFEPAFKRREDLCTKLRDLPEDKNYKGPVQETQWRRRTSSRKFW